MKKPSTVREKIERRADRATEWIGSTKSVLVHSIVFAVAFLLPLFGADFDRVLLILTTAVSLEAIYLAIFIQMTVNKNTEDIEEIQEDVEEIQVDVDEIQKDVDEIQEDIEDIEEVQGKEEIEELQKQKKDYDLLSDMQKTLKKMSEEIEDIKKRT
ncbi:MAG TPA: hypothetical protein VLB02_01435 [Candidatus Paceibacterota bacterium]|nr:hypothetical protein [Candidatus Paceibacterota bacterium]